jgi:RHH-type proline utilization regulon transcriptional repressor/proline dehydrogenase/delta 1-pyrroline-5-carboxylate dehydrogenase
MMATTMGVKIDKRMRQRLIAAALSLEKTPHWLMKRAIVDWLERVEAGADLAELTGMDPNDRSDSFNQLPDRSHQSRS